MIQEIESGYLATLFQEPIYLIGFERLENVKKETNPVAAEPPLLNNTKQEVKLIPKLPPKEQTTVEGKLNKRCLALYSEDDELKEQDRLFLKKVLEQGVQLKPEEYEVVNFKGLTIHDVAERYTYEKLIFFGTTVPQLKLDLYKCTQVKSTEIIYADAVWMVVSNEGYKKLLWLELKKMFKL